jgi:hypothetical protein
MAKSENLVAQVNGRVRVIPSRGGVAQILVTPRAILRAAPPA